MEFIVPFILGGVYTVIILGVGIGIGREQKKEDI